MVEIFIGRTQLLRYTYKKQFPQFIQLQGPCHWLPEYVLAMIPHPPFIISGSERHRRSGIYRDKSPSGGVVPNQTLWMGDANWRRGVS